MVPGHDCCHAEDLELSSRKTGANLPQVSSIHKRIRDANFREVLEGFTVSSQCAVLLPKIAFSCFLLLQQIQTD